MKSIWSFIFLLTSLFFPYSLAYGAASRLDKAALSVWKVMAEEDLESAKMQETGVFIGPNHFIATAAFLNAASDITGKEDALSLTLLQEEGAVSSLKLAKVVKISFLDNLVIFETEQSVENYLSLAEKPLELGEDLFLITYPPTIFSRIDDGKFLTTPPRKTIKDLKLFFEDKNRYFLSVSSGLEGNTGGPILNERGQLVGIVSSATDTMLTVTKVSRLKELIIQDIEVRCSSLKPSDVEACINQEMEKLKDATE